MPRRVLDWIRKAIRDAAYDITSHAVEEIAEDKLDLVDVETAILNGKLIKTEKDDPRGTRYTVHGIGVDGITLVGATGRFTETGRSLIITVYEVTESEI
jgi:hypothetical protein